MNEFSERTTLVGSTRRAHAVGHQQVGEVREHERSTVLVRLRRGMPVSRHFQLSRQAFSAIHSAFPEDVTLLHRFAAYYGLDVGRCDNAAATIELSGREGDLCAAFGCAPRRVVRWGNGQTYRSYLGTLSVPRELAAVALAVLGLHEGPVAKSRLRPSGRNLSRCLLRSSDGTPQPIFADELNAVYNIPQGNGDGSGLFVGIYSLGGGYLPSDLKTICAMRGFNPLRVIDVGFDGATNAPGDDAQQEVTLDITDAMLILNKAGLTKATIVACFGENSEPGALNLLNGMLAWRDPASGAALRLGSCSWGSAEVDNSPMYLESVDDALAAGLSQGIPFLSASGDDGSSDGARGNNVDSFASSPHCLGIGGTRLIRNPDGSRQSETAWGAPGDGATGGGLSREFSSPGFQAGLGYPQRAVPDLSAVADPASGSVIYITLPNGQSGMMVVGGTSAATPIVAAGLAVVSTWLDGPLGDLHGALYGMRDAFYDVTQGSNGAFRAGPGYDPVTGLGVPDFSKVRDALVASRKGQPPAAPTPPTPTPPAANPPGDDQNDPPNRAPPALNLLETIGLNWLRRGGATVHMPAQAGDDVSIQF